MTTRVELRLRLHGDDQLGHDGHDGRLGELGHLRVGSDDHPHDGDGGEHRRRRQRQRVEDVGGREHRDHPGDATNAVGTNHVLTITVNAVNGTLDAGTHTRPRAS